MTTLACTIPIRTVTGNVRECWQARTRRVKRERKLTRLNLLAQIGRTPPALPVTVTLVRVSMGRPDGDNAITGLKGARDEVAAWLQADDGDPRITWVYGMARGEYAVRVTIETTTGANE